MLKIPRSSTHYAYAALDPNDPRWPIWEKYYSNFPDFRKHDQLIIPSSLLTKMADTLIDATNDKSRVLYLLENPGLEELNLQIQLENGNSLFNIVYKRSYFRGKELEITGYNGKTSKAYPVVDAFITYQDVAIISQPYRIAIFIASLPDPDSDAGYSLNAVWTNNPRFDDTDMVVVRAAWFYLVAQELFHRRPFFYQESTRRIAAPAHPSKQKKQKRNRHNTVKIRSIKLTTNDIDESIKPIGTKKRTYTCERWGVSGHERRLKSGKIIWVRPYEKGAKRNDPEANYAPKNYKPE